MRNGALAPAASPANAARQLVAATAQLLDAAIDAATRQAGRLRGRGDAAIALGQGFIGGK